MILAGATAVHCTQAGGTLELTSKKSRILDDGETAEIKIRATDLAGNVGAGVVTFSADGGTFGQNPVKLDAYGTGTTTYSCNVLIDPTCTGSITLTGTWNGAIGELTLRMLERCPGGRLCGDECAILASSWHHCGACGHRCLTTEKCEANACVPCNGDCDSDGWSPPVDCCDQFDVCSKPASVNPGAIETLGNGLDDNCNGLLDGADVLDVEPCDATLSSRPATSMEYAQALGLCRTTTEGEKTWGVISSELLLANGTTAVPPNTASIRPVFGKLQPLEGRSMVVLATGVASDAVQTDPSLSDPPANTSVDLSMCTAPGCLTDWLSASSTVKQAGKLPNSPNCGSPSEQKTANDSVMLRMRIRAPTNAKSFKMRSRFFSHEYPKFVCSAFNDQMVLLIDTPGAQLGNPSDKNLMTYSSDGGAWPIGINLAAGTPLFQVCQPKNQFPMCWDTDVNVSSCGLGPGDLDLTQYAPDTPSGCVNGGGTVWMATRGNVKPGAIFELRAAIWDVGDHALDSLVLMDDFKWNTDFVDAGTGE